MFFCLSLLLPALIIGFFPFLDLAVSGFFYTPGEGFVKTPFLEFIHHYGPYIVVALALAAALILAWKKVIGRREVTFIALCFALGPGLVVNGIFKEHYGRARPVHIEQFGGKATFTSALTQANQCEHNCSFTSGDPAPGFALIGFALLFPHRRRVLAALSLGIGGAFGLMRIAQGGHFLSDVLFTGVFCTGTALLLFKIMYWKKRRAASAVR